jgi:hypothetical protein
VESGGNIEDYIVFLSSHLFGPVNHGQNWKGWERSGEIITISDTCKNQPKRLDSDNDNVINLSRLIVRLVTDWTPITDFYADSPRIR